MFRRMLGVFLVALAVVGLFSVPQAMAQEKIKVGMLLFNNEQRYTQAEKGVLAQLKKEGYGENKVDFIRRSADGDKAKAKEFANELKDSGVKIICAFGTSAALAAYEVTKEIPIVISVVYDAVGAKLAKSLESSGNNVTGASNFVPIKYIVQLLNRIKPVKSMGVLYSEAERNSVIQVEEMRKIKDEMGYSLTEINVSAKEQLKDAALKLAEAKVDFIFVTGSAVVSKNTSIILEVANANKIGTVSHLPEIVKEGGVLISISANAFKLGELSGKKAAQILKGANPSSLAIETLSNYDITLNMKTAKNMDLYIPNDVFKSATEIIK